MRVLPLLLLGARYYENAPKYYQFSHTLTPPSHLSALHSARNSSHASHLCAQLCPLRGKSLCSIIRLNFFLFFFFLSSSSSTRFWSCFFFFFFFKFYFCLIWSEKYVLKVEICYQNTKQHWFATKNHQVQTNSEAFFFFTECGKKIFRSCMLLFSSASALFDLFSRNPEID